MVQENQNKSAVHEACCQLNIELCAGVALKLKSILDLMHTGSVSYSTAVQCKPLPVISCVSSPNSTD